MHDNGMAWLDNIRGLYNYNINNNIIRHRSNPIISITTNTYNNVYNVYSTFDRQIVLSLIYKTRLH